MFSSEQQLDKGEYTWYSISAEKNARLAREAKRLIAVSILIGHILLASTYLSKY
jgi:hypothetical protein